MAFPCEAGLAGWIGKQKLAGGGAADLPLLGFATEADVRGPEDFKPSKRTEIYRFGVHAVDVTAGLEAEGGVSHGSLVSGHW